MRTHPLSPVAAAGGGQPIVMPAPSPSPALHLASDDQRDARALVTRLRDHIARMEQNQNRLDQKRNGHDRSAKPTRSWTFNLPTIDAHFPEQGLQRHGLHDIAPHRYGDNTAAMGFALGLAILRLESDRQGRPILWCRSAIECREHGKLYGHGVEQLGLPRTKLLTLILKKQVSLFWTMEEALKSGCFACVISDAASQHTDITITRRLNLSAGDGKSAGLLVFNRNHVDATASFSRWHVSSTPSTAPPLEKNAPGPPAWGVELSRIRGGKPGQWTLSWHRNYKVHHASHHFSLVSGIPGGALPQGKAQAPGAPSTQGPTLRAG
jgi:protein ImuA